MIARADEAGKPGRGEEAEFQTDPIMNAPLRGGFPFLCFLTQLGYKHQPITQGDSKHVFPAEREPSV